MSNSNIRELSFDEIELVSGGKASYSAGARARNHGHARHTLQRNAPTHIYSDPSTVKCANNVFGRMAKGVTGGPLGMARGVAIGAWRGQCLSSHNGGSGNKGAKSSASKCSSHGYNGSCHR